MFDQELCLKDISSLKVDSAVGGVQDGAARWVGWLQETLRRVFVFLLSLQIHETIESINQLKIQRDFMLSFSRDPKGYIQDWLKSQSRDLKVPSCYLYAHTLLLLRTQWNNNSIWRLLFSPIVICVFSLSVVNDGRGWEPWGGEEGSVLPWALVSGGRQSLFLL